MCATPSRFPGRPGTLGTRELYSENTPFELGELVARLGRLLELEGPGVLAHLLLQRAHFARDLLLAHCLVAGLGLRRGKSGLRLVRVVHAVDQVLDALDHALRRDAVALVVRNLLAPPAVGFGDGP